MIYNSENRSYLMNISQSSSIFIDFQIELQVIDALTTLPLRNNGVQDLFQTIATTTRRYINTSFCNG